ncbi:L-lactate dehydrogenase complex protein LldG [Prevotella sp. ne3005]|jgi:L-lactate dehydrogenase complex protein LldG|uniref:LutC/YkgG family protein n=1 Tax=Prevotella sp. ne3005 TaxID=1761887 RepID=UPI0008B16F78|nr:LUD domain-containing protein [Prevotella sp. ne3005]SEN11021.1 L-lactate dehydrogenase complex protein LldG [Prevotella sp. ne3005]
MSNKDDILKKYRANVKEKFDMPDLSDIKAITYPNPLVQFVKMSEMVGGQVIEVDAGRDINVLIRELFPEAKEIASNLPEITIATRNPDTVGRARDLNGTDVGIIRGQFGVAENGCIWIPQTMKEKAICFISENLIILLPKSQIVNNMHEAYKRIEFDKTYDGYGTFISGPSKTADIAQVLVMGAQAARSATILLLPE